MRCDGRKQGAEVEIKGGIKMDREILFRGMDDNKRLIQGYFFQIWEDCFILWGTTNGVPNMTKVDPTTVGQFTGLCDKDGKKIFEGDVVFVGYGEYYQGAHEYSTTMTIDMSDYEELNALCNANVVEVIGNIHDTPDLAKEESE